MRRNKEAGQALITAAVAMVVLVGFAGLGVDMGVMRYERRLQQTAADAAAIAGANNLAATSGGVIAGGQNAAAANGFADTGGGALSACTASGATVGTVCVQISDPASGPTTGPHAGNPKYVEAYVAKVQPTYFMKIMGVTTAVVTARAVATNTSGGPNNGCLFTLGKPTDSIEGVNINGNATLDAVNCGIVDDGDFNTQGNSLFVSAASFGLSGSPNQTGPGGTVTCPSTCPTPMIAQPDPLASLTPPCSGASCGAGTSTKISGGTCKSGCGNVSCAGNTCTINPGTYSDITLSGGATNIVFNAGMYVIDGGSFGGANNCNSACLTIPANATATGTGVTFYFTNSSTVNITGTPNITLTAPSTGTYAGILMYQDPLDTNQGPAPAGPALGGNSGSSYNGILYFPKDQLTFFGNAGGTNCNQGYSAGMVVTESFALSGHPTVCLQGPAGLPPGVNPITVATLVE
jgi:hypothetical protein